MKHTRPRSRILALLLALAMCLSLMPGVALAAENAAAVIISPTSFSIEIEKGQTEATADFQLYPPAGHIPADAGGTSFVEGNLRPVSNNSDVSFQIQSVAEVTDGSYRVTLRFDTSKICTEAGTHSYASGLSVQVLPNLAGYFTGAVAETSIPIPLTITVKDNSPQQITNFEVRFYYNGGTLVSSQGLEGFEGDYGGKFYQLLSDNTGRATTLPQVTRSEYTFDGWYTAETGGERITTTTALNPYLGNAGAESRTDLVNLWAHWTKQPERGPMIFFCPNGGTITEINGHSRNELLSSANNIVNLGVGIELTNKAGMVYADASGKLPCFPTVTREGYTFDGWYGVPLNQLPASVSSNSEPEFMTEFGSYPKASLSNTYSDSSTWYVAKWTKAADTYTVTFNLNGGSGTTPEPLKVPKDGAITLPEKDPTRSGYVFQGWISGDIVVDHFENIVWWHDGDKVTGNITLYAAWTEDNADDTLKGLTYRFGNSSSDYGYSNGYKIPEARYELIFGKNQLANDLYKRAANWGGNCYGMSITSTMFFESRVPTTSFKSGSTVPYDLSVSNRNSSWNLSLTEYIEAMHISQKAQSVQNQIKQNRNNLSALQTAIKSSPVIVTIYGPEGGHAVVGYDVKTVTNADGRSETGLMIYDPNYPNQEKYITLTGSSGWSYYLGQMQKTENGKLVYDEAGKPVYVDVTWSSSNGWISYVPYTVAAQVWTNRGSEQNYYNTMNLASISANNATISDSSGKVVATIQNGEITSTQGDVTPIYETDITTNGTSAPAMWLPTGQYTVTNGDATSFQVSMVNVDQSATVSTAASSVTFLVDDSKTTNSVQVDGAGKSYDITLSSTLDQGYKEVTLTGTTSAETTAVAQISGKLYGTNLDTKGTLKVDGKSSDSSILAGTVPNVSAASQPTKPAGTNPFTDVASSAYYYDAVLWAVENGVTSGTSATTFSPNDPCTRAQIVTFLWRASGSPQPTTASNPFKDVQAGAYYYDAVLWAVEKGITSGTSADTFSPSDSCTRAQTVTFLWRSAGSPKSATTTNPFADVQSGTYYYDAVLWAVENGITSGTGANTFSPADTVTRGQTVTFLYRSQGK